MRCSYLQSPTPIPERPRLVNVGRLSEQKGQLLLIEAAALLLANKALTSNWSSSVTARYAASLSGSSISTACGAGYGSPAFLDNQGVRRELEAARALVMPSFAEGLPVVIMEALALGRPVISTYIAGIPELVEPGRHGWLVPAGAVEPLAAAMAAALTAETVELETMGRAGAARVAERHNVNNEAKKLAELIADLAAIPSVENR